jgi:stage III sporulation protein AB
MIKIISCICFICAGAVCGAVQAEKLRKNRNICRDICDMLNVISSLIRYRALDVYEIAAELKNEKFDEKLRFVSSLSEHYEPGTDFHEMWNSAVLLDSDIPEEESCILISFGNSLGTSDIDGQLLSIASASERLNEIEKQRSAEYTKKSRLYRSVGILFGTMIGIIVL